MIEIDRNDADRDLKSLNKNLVQGARVIATRVDPLFAWQVALL